MSSTIDRQLPFGISRAGLLGAHRVVAWLEAISWALLLIAMCFKYLGDQPDAIRVPGMVHGGMFMLFVVLTLAVAWVQNWPIVVSALALFSSIPPFGTIVFELVAGAKGYLSPTYRRAVIATPTPVPAQR